MSNALLIKKVVTLFDVDSCLGSIGLFHVLSSLELAETLVHHSVEVVLHDLIASLFNDLMSEDECLLTVLHEFLEVILLKDVKKGGTVLGTVLTLSRDNKVKK